MPSTLIKACWSGLHVVEVEDVFPLLGGEPEESSVLVDGLLPLYPPAAEGDGPVADSPCHPDAEPVGAAPAFPAGYDFQVVDVLRDPDEFLGFHQVEGYSALDVLPVEDDALGDVTDDGSLDDLGEYAVLVHLALGEAEVVHVAVEGVLHVEGEESVLQGGFHGRLLGTDQDCGLLALGQPRVGEGLGQIVQVGVGVVNGYGGETGVESQPVHGSYVELGRWPWCRRWSLPGPAGPGTVSVGSPRSG